MPMVGHPEIDQAHGTVRAYACTAHKVIGLECTACTARKALGSFVGECVALNFLITIAYLTNTYFLLNTPAGVLATLLNLPFSNARKSLNTELQVSTLY